MEGRETSKINGHQNRQWKGHETGSGGRHQPPAHANLTTSHNHNYGIVQMNQLSSGSRQGKSVQGGVSGRPQDPLTSAAIRHFGITAFFAPGRRRL